MEYDEEKVDDAALALLYLMLHDDNRVWKGIDWGILGRLYQKGLIFDPVGKSRSIVFTAEGLQRSEELFRKLFQTGE